MAINDLSVTVFQDHKRNTATVYLKFPKIKDEIYMGFDLDNFGDYKLSKSSKSKLDRCQVDGVSSAICLQPDNRIHMALYMGQETIYLFLNPTYQYPITHQGQWTRIIKLEDWINDNYQI
jgi:hypothetical protein